MRELKLTVTDDDYRRMLRIAYHDRTEVAGVSNASKYADFSEEGLIDFFLRYAVKSQIESGESYWGEYKEDYMQNAENG